MEPPKSLEFKISTGLKNVLGQDLIIDRDIAIYELVKNSYDAGASKVIIKFKDINSDNAMIIIQDDGCGMSLEDIQNKWLFVAYSEKKHFRNNSFRDQIPRRIPAGAKGVGRFSCDRLGTTLTLTTKAKNASEWNQLFVDWSDFDIDDTRNFDSISVPFKKIKANIEEIAKNGTILTIRNLRERWDRKSILNLKKSLMKLINPDFNQDEDPFSIFIRCEEEEKADNDQISTREKVNGKIINDVFERLNIKTTSLEVNISDDGKEISTSLVDRGDFVFKIVERNKRFQLLNNISFSIFYLNRSAKISFKKIMGIPPIQYGSVFIYKNGFRVQPFGNPGTDYFKIDLRKNQGRNRFLGTRDIIGRIQILGENSGFIETTSRDRGFLDTQEFRQLEAFFLDKVIKVLEKYVVGLIHWGDPTKEEWALGKEQGLKATDVLEQIVKSFSLTSTNEEIIKIIYGDKVEEFLENSQKNNIASSIQKLETAVLQDGNTDLSLLVNKIKLEAEILKKQHFEAEREINESMQSLYLKEKRISDNEKQISFLSKQVSAEVKNLQTGYHSIISQCSTLEKTLKHLVKFLKSNCQGSDKSVLNQISSLVFTSKRIKQISYFSLYGKLSNPSDSIEANIFEFIKQYIKRDQPIRQYLSISIGSENGAENTSYFCKFSPISISMAIDNIFSNSRKKKATKLEIIFKNYESNFEIHFIDNGLGIDPQISDINDIFKFGYTTSEDGFGLGLYHIKKIADDMGSEVLVNLDYKDGFDIFLRIRK